MINEFLQMSPFEKWCYLMMLYIGFGAILSFFPKVKEPDGWM